MRRFAVGCAAVLGAVGFMDAIQGCETLIGWEEIALVTSDESDEDASTDEPFTDSSAPDAFADAADACEASSPLDCRDAAYGSCRETCPMLESREPKVSEVDGRARVMKLSLVQDDCRHLVFHVRKLDPTEFLHAGEYRLLAGSCKQSALVRAMVVVNQPTKDVEMTIDYEDGTCRQSQKLFCAVKKDGSSISYWFSNVLIVGNRCSCDGF